MSAANSVFPGATGPEQPAEQGLDPALAAAGELARQAAAEEAGAEYVGAHVGVQPEPSGAATHLFDSELPGYRGWRWAVTVADAGAETEVTVSEVVLLPGPDALVAPAWVPWQQRVRAGDLGVGDLMPPAQDDPRLAQAYLQSDDPEVEEVATELGLGRVHVLSRLGRLEAAERWQESDFGPGSDMARSAPEHCGNCGFYLQLAGSLRAAFGVCGNEISPADGRVVHVEYGCGAHSEIEVAMGSPVPVADLVYDDTVLDIEPLDSADASPEPEPDSAVAPAEPAEVLEAEVAEPETTVADAEPAAEAVTAPAASEPEAEATTEPEAAAPIGVEASAPKGAESADFRADPAAEVNPVPGEPSTDPALAAQPPAAETALTQPEPPSTLAEAEPTPNEPITEVPVAGKPEAEAAVAPVELEAEPAAAVPSAEAVEVPVAEAPEVEAALAPVEIEAPVAGETEAAVAPVESEAEPVAAEPSVEAVEAPVIEAPEVETALAAAEAEAPVAGESEAAVAPVEPEAEPAAAESSAEATLAEAPAVEDAEAASAPVEPEAAAVETEAESAAVVADPITEPIALPWLRKDDITPADNSETEG